MWFVWDSAYFTAMNHELANEIALHILLSWDMNLLISKNQGLSPMDKTGLVRDPRRQWVESMWLKSMKTGGQDP
jgi:hypothetical protein